MGYRFIRTLARDRAIDTDELAFIAHLAERDCIADDDERQVAGRILGRISRRMVGPDIWYDLERFKRRMGV